MEKIKKEKAELACKLENTCIEHHSKYFSLEFFVQNGIPKISIKNNDGYKLNLHYSSIGTLINNLQFIDKKIQELELNAKPFKFDVKEEEIEPIAIITTKPCTTKCGRQFKQDKKQKTIDDERWSE